MAEEKVYIVTDQCAYEEVQPEGYNRDPKRKPHAVMLIEQKTGSVHYLLSGSRIKIVEERLPDML